MAAALRHVAALSSQSAWTAMSRGFSIAVPAATGIRVNVGNANAPTADDVHVAITLVNSLGERVRIPAKIGKTLTQAASSYGYTDLRSPCEGTMAAIKQHKTAGGWEEPTFGEGAYCSHCMVVLPEDKAGLLPKQVDDEQQRLADYPFREDVGKTSRLGCRVVVTKDMDGMVVFVPDGAETEST